MASDLAVGDVELPFIDVAPADGDTTATLEVRPPGGTPYPITLTGGDLAVIPGTNPVEHSQRWTADTPVEYTVAGRWVLHFDTGGTGEGAEDFEVYVVPSPTAGGPTWLPGRSRVANYVLHRTLARNPAAIINSQSVYEMTFTRTTTPTGLQVDRLIADGAAWVGMRVSPLPTPMHDVASVIVSLYAAAALERQFKADEQSLQRANDMEKRMEALLDDLVAASNALGGTGDYGVEVVHLPVWSFPEPDPRYDYPGYF